jgi:hypothetical protein
MKMHSFNPYSTKSWGLVANSHWRSPQHPTLINIQVGTTAGLPHSFSMATHMHASTTLLYSASHAKTAATPPLPAMLAAATSAPAAARCKHTPSPSCLAPECMMLSPEPATLLVKTATGLATATAAPKKRCKLCCSLCTVRGCNDAAQAVTAQPQTRHPTASARVRSQQEMQQQAGTAGSSSLCIIAALAVTCQLRRCCVEEIAVDIQPMTESMIS